MIVVVAHDDRVMERRIDVSILLFFYVRFSLGSKSVQFQVMKVKSPSIKALS